MDYDKQQPIFKKYGVRTVPVLVYLKNGKMVAKEFGVKSPSDIQSSVNKYFK